MNKLWVIIILSILVIILSILFILAVIGIIGKNKCKDSFKNVNNNTGEWKNYRLGDCVGYGNQDEACKGPPNSLSVKYHETTKNKNDYEVLNDIIPVQPSEFDATIHMRVGNVIEGSEHSVDKHWRENLKVKGGGLYETYYVKPESYWLKIIDKLPPNVKTIELISGGHRGGNESKSNDYIDRVKKLFESKGYNITMNGSGNPDEDFTKLANSNIYIPSGGNFSNKAGEIVKLRNKLVIIIDNKSI